MRFDLISIFPDYFAPLRLSLMGKAEDAGLVQLQAHDLREWATGKHRSVDDTPYGGGAGMVMRADVWARALDEVLAILRAAPPDTLGDLRAQTVITALELRRELLELTDRTDQEAS